MKKLLFSILLLLAVPLAIAAPADGNGNKFVAYFEGLDIPILCDADDVPDLTLDVVGWLQGREFGGYGDRNAELTVYHFDLTYTNARGETWTWRDRGPDRLYFVRNNETGEPELYVAITGRSGTNIIGHVVFNLATSEFVLVAGQHPFGGDVFGPTSDDFACEYLLED
jgi:hypothetical protein